MYTRTVMYTHVYITLYVCARAYVCDVCTTYFIVSRNFNANDYC